MLWQFVGVQNLTKLYEIMLTPFERTHPYPVIFRWFLGLYLGRDGTLRSPCYDRKGMWSNYNRTWSD